MNSQLSDQPARDEALNIKRSYIVQAPAGSGKTGLLTLRFLKLLTISESPEQIVAITFTRKAASEMRDRIIKTLTWTEDLKANKSRPKEGFDHQRFTIAEKVLARDEELNWGLLTSPTRLRIQTIDAFCFYLANKLPVLSRLGGNPRITPEIDDCFRDAITNTFRKLESDQSISDDIEKVLVHLDNDFGRIERLLISLLKNRDQWLSYILEINDNNDDARVYTERCIRELIEESISEVAQELRPFAHSLLELLNFSLINQNQLESPRHLNTNQFTQLPGTTINDVPSWHIIVELLTTAKGTWRKSLTKLNGFPSGSGKDKEHQIMCKNYKLKMLALLEELSGKTNLLITLSYLLLLPSSSINNRHWEFLTSLTRIMAQLGSELLISFRKFGIIDYTEVGAAARSALGTSDEPTDLALSLDLSIDHILIDEFQDTSQLQLGILQQLVSGWSEEEQKTLFMVGDPMQSCYGFRNANVGIYLNVQQNGIPGLKINSLKLRANFRSNKNIVDWVNRHFFTAFPTKSNTSRGAVPFSYSESVNNQPSKPRISTELISYKNTHRTGAKQAEAEKVIEAIRKIRLSSSTEDIAILVRSRSHLAFIIPELNANNLNWLSTDIDRMGSMQLVEDLISLTKALLNPYDRLSWLAILRAPWIGLEVSDLYSISQDSLDKSVWKSINNLKDTNSISSDGRQRLSDFTDCIRSSMNHRYRTPLRELVQSSWELLRGGGAIKTAREVSCAAKYFNLLAEHESAGGIKNFDFFREQVYASFIPTFYQPALKPPSKPIQLLTMHKAKGLEFDHVIIPGLGNTPGSDDKPLLAWHERLNSKGQARLLISASTEVGAEEDKLYQLILHERTHKVLLENTRLLYIAITRAKESVNLLGTLSLNKNQELQIPQKSLLSRLWNELQRESINFKIEEYDPITPEPKILKEQKLPFPTPLERFKETQGLNERAKRYFQKKAEPPAIERMEIDHQVKNRLDACAGDLIHGFFENYTKKPKIDSSLFASINAHRNYWEIELKKRDQSERNVDKALDFISNSIKETLCDKDLQWIFDDSTENSRSEFSISTNQNGVIRTYIIDRTFVDKNNTRWIIDYKTGATVNENEADFIRTQSRLHRGQLSYYKNLFSKLESKKTRIALLFTAIPKLVEIHE